MRRARHNPPEFATALLSPTAPVPRGLTGPGGSPGARRFNIYRNNVVAGLIDALRDIFPAVRRIVGVEFFDAMAKAYVTTNPPRSPVLLKYGETFPMFIPTFAPAMALPYLADVAAIEFAWLKAYHAPDQLPLDRRAFVAVAEGLAPQLRLTLHPSAQVLRSAFPALTIWHANRENDDVAEIRLDQGGEDVFLVRPAADVDARLLGRGNAVFLAALAEQKTLAEATAKAVNEHRDFDLASALSGAIDAGGVVAFRVPRKGVSR